MSSPFEERPVGVIHDIGYRPYSGPRLRESAVARSLFITGLRNCFGLGRSGKSKVLPMLLLAIMLLPALILVGVLVQARTALNLDSQILPYSAYPTTLLLIITVFVAAQAPTLISRDLRFRTITLYLARPLRRSTYVLVRVASLTAAVFLLVVSPLLLLYVGGLLAELPVGAETKDFAVAVVGAFLLAAVLAGLAALVSAVTTRRGLAVTAVIVVLLVSYTVVVSVQGIATEFDNDTVAELAGVFSPYTLVDGLQVWLFDTDTSGPAGPTSTWVGLVYLFVTVLVVAGSVAGLLLRYRKVGAV
ncbi:MAG: ABC transporter permease [Propionibacteriales bacterium]|nr:ABC transporter permease [Propionibacteriales bacterium]